MKKNMLKSKKAKDARVVLNVSGEIYETLEDTLVRFPATVLGSLSKYEPHYCAASKQYFFHRNRMCFAAILFFYQSNGILRCPPGIPLELFEEECMFFQLPSLLIQDMKFKEGFLVKDTTDAEIPEVVPYSPFTSRLWNLLENPQSSVFAWCYALTSLTASMLSVWILCLATTSLGESRESAERLKLIDRVLNIYFCFDISLRLIFTQNRLAFIKVAMTWIDISTSLAYLISLVCENDANSRLCNILIFIRMLRVLRLFRLAKHSKRLQVAGEILVTICRDLKLFLVCIILIAIFFGSLMHFIERDRLFESLPNACWWAVQTVTTVGYGDIVPITPEGKLFAGIFMAFGTQLVLLPVLTIVNKFTTMYNKN